MPTGAEFGPGKYGHICEEILERLKAKGVVLIVLDGEKGSGMNLSAPAWEWDMAGYMEMIRNLPNLLRAVAQSIDAARIPKHDAR